MRRVSRTSKSCLAPVSLPASTAWPITWIMAGSRAWNDFWKGVRCVERSANITYKLGLVIRVDVLSNDTKRPVNKPFRLRNDKI